MPKQSTPQAAPTQAPPPEATDQSAPIQFADPVSPADLTAGTGETPAAAVAAVEATLAPQEKPIELGITDKEMSALQAEANRDNIKKDFFDKVHAARVKEHQEPAAPPPIAPRIVDQTNAELQAGAALVAKNEELRVRRSPPVPDNTEGKNTAVFRPGDYVPNQRKGQGNVQGRNL